MKTSMKLENMIYPTKFNCSLNGLSALIKHNQQHDKYSIIIVKNETKNFENLIVVKELQLNKNEYQSLNDVEKFLDYYYKANQYETFFKDCISINSNNIIGLQELINDCCSIV